SSRAGRSAPASSARAFGLGGGRRALSPARSGDAIGRGKGALAARPVRTAPRYRPRTPPRKRGTLAGTAGRGGYGAAAGGRGPCTRRYRGAGLFDAFRAGFAGGGAHRGRRRGNGHRGHGGPAV